MENEIVMQWWILARDQELMIVSCPSDNDPLHGYGSWGIWAGPFASYEEANAAGAEE